MAFTGKTAIITGGGSGIGRACALGLGKQGARVAVWDVNGFNAASVADEVKELGVRSLPVRVDVSRTEQIEAATRRTLDEFSHIDILVNAAGVALTPKPLLETTPAELQRVFAINLKGVWHCAQFAARDMIKRRSGRIINIASIAGKVPRLGLGPYCISKAAVIHFTRCLALELAPLWRHYSQCGRTRADAYQLTPKLRPSRDSGTGQGAARADVERRCGAVSPRHPAGEDRRTGGSGGSRHLPGLRRGRLHLWAVSLRGWDGRRKLKSQPTSWRERSARHG